MLCGKFPVAQKRTTSVSVSTNKCAFQKQFTIQLKISPVNFQVFKYLLRVVFRSWMKELDFECRLNL